MLQVHEILELKKALAKTRQDLLKTRSRREAGRESGGRSSSEEEGGTGRGGTGRGGGPARRDSTEMTGSLTGSMNALSNKPCLNRYWL